METEQQTMAQQVKNHSPYPMLATGMSMEIAYQAMLKHGKPAHTHLCCTIGTQQAIDYLRATLPADEDITLWCAAIDPVLIEHKYIVPGLGDAGDLCFGPKLRALALNTILLSPRLS